MAAAREVREVVREAAVAREAVAARGKGRAVARSSEGGGGKGGGDGGGGEGGSSGGGEKEVARTAVKAAARVAAAREADRVCEARPRRGRARRRGARGTESPSRRSLRREHSANTLAAASSGQPAAQTKPAEG